MHDALNQQTSAQLQASTSIQYCTTETARVRGYAMYLQNMKKNAFIKYVRGEASFRKNSTVRALPITAILGDEKSVLIVRARTVVVLYNIPVSGGEMLY